VGRAGIGGGGTAGQPERWAAGEPAADGLTGDPAEVTVDIDPVVAGEVRAGGYVCG
jgi:hypothetical protein